MAQNDNSWLVIMNQSLADSEIHNLLLTQKNKIKGQDLRKYSHMKCIHVILPAVSTGTLPHTCIFPQSSAAFMILPISETLTEWPPKQCCCMDPTLSQRLLRFSELHHKCFVLLCAPMLGSNEQRVVSALQQKHMNAELSFLVAHNSNECVECMLSIVKVTCKAVSSVIRQRMERVHEQLLSEEAVLSTIQMCGVSRHSSTVLLDGCGSLGRVAKASSNVEQLMECSLDSKTAQSVHRYFSQ